MIVTLSSFEKLVLFNTSDIERNASEMLLFLHRCFYDSTYIGGGEVGELANDQGLLKLYRPDKNGNYPNHHSRDWEMDSLSITDSLDSLIKKQHGSKYNLSDYRCYCIVRNRYITVYNKLDKYLIYPLSEIYKTFKVENGSVLFSNKVHSTLPKYEYDYESALLLSDKKALKEKVIRYGMTDEKLINFLTLKVNMGSYKDLFVMRITD